MTPATVPDPAPATPSPPVPDVFERLHPNARLALRLGTIAALLLLGAIPLAVLLAAWDATGLSGSAKVSVWLLAQLLLALGGWAWGGLRHARTGFLLDPHGLRIRRGVMWRSETFVPRARVQHTDVNRGPLDRRLGLSTLKLHTAGTRLATVTLDGLPAERAVQLRDALAHHDDDHL